MDLRKRLGRALIAIASPALLFAQVDLGDLVATGAGSGLTFVRPGTGQVWTVPLPGLPAAPACALWDPRNPQEFLVGGPGFVARAALGGAQGATTQLLTSFVGEITELAWDATGRLLAFDATTQALRIVHPLTGVLQQHSPETTPWPHGGRALAVASFTGDVHLAGFDLWRLPAPTLPLALGCGGDQEGFVDLAADELTGDLFALHSHLDQLLRIDPAGQALDVLPPGALVGAQALTVLQDGDLVVARGREFHLVPRFGGGTGMLALLPSALAPLSSLGVVGAGRPFLLEVEGTPDQGVVFTLHHVTPFAWHGWTLASAATTGPRGFGPAAGLVPDDLAWSLVLRHPAPQVGHPWHWLANVPNHHPSVPHAFAPGTTATVTGQTFDFVSLALGATGDLLATTNVVRITF